MRQVIYRRPLPVQREDDGLGTVFTIVRFVPLLAAPAALVVFFATGAIVVLAVVALVGGFWLWRRLGPPRPETLRPDFAALNGEAIEVAGPGITKRFEPAVRLPLGEVAGWRVERAKGVPYGDPEALSFTHGLRTYRLDISHAQHFDLEPLKAIAPQAVAELQRG